MNNPKRCQVNNNREDSEMPENLISRVRWRYYLLWKELQVNVFISTYVHSADKVKWKHE